MISKAFFILLIEDAVQKVRSLARDDILDKVERGDKNINRTITGLLLSSDMIEDCLTSLPSWLRN